MHFMHVDTHSPEKGLLDEPKVTKQLMARVKQGAEKANVRIVGPCLARQDYTIFAVVEGYDYAATCPHTDLREALPPRPCSVGSPAFPRAMAGAARGR